jgi:hypothetical protein
MLHTDSVTDRRTSVNETGKRVARSDIEGAEKRGRRLGDAKHGHLPLEWLW